MPEQNAVMFGSLTRFRETRSYLALGGLQAWTTFYRQNHFPLVKKINLLQFLENKQILGGGDLRKQDHCPNCGLCGSEQLQEQPMNVIYDVLSRFVSHSMAIKCYLPKTKRFFIQHLNGILYSVTTNTSRPLMKFRPWPRTLSLFLSTYIVAGINWTQVNMQEPWQYCYLDLLIKKPSSVNSFRNNNIRMFITWMICRQRLWELTELDSNL